MPNQNDNFFASAGFNNESSAVTGVNTYPATFELTNQDGSFQITNRLKAGDIIFNVRIFKIGANVTPNTPTPEIYINLENTGAITNAINIEDFNLAGLDASELYYQVQNNGDALTLEVDNAAITGTISVLVQVKRP